MTAFVVWRLADDDRNLWMPTDCDSLEAGSYSAPFLCVCVVIENWSEIRLRNPLTYTIDRGNIMVT